MTSDPCVARTRPHPVAECTLSAPASYTALDAAWVAAISRDDHQEAKRLEPLIEHPPTAVSAVPLVAAALWYAQHGWPVFPCQPGGKQPACTHGFHDATTDPDQIRAWWARLPNANIGLPTGVTLDVFDFDGDRHGLWAFNKAAITGADLPRLRGASATPRGMHLYIPATGHGTKVGIYPGVDYRGAGGYVIVPPSRTPAGVYRWILPLSKGQ